MCCSWARKVIHFRHKVWDQMAQCQPSNAFGYITKSPSYSPFISNCLENKLINTSMIFPEKSEKSRETSPTSPMKFPRFGTPLPWKNHPMIPMMKNDMSRSRPPDWMWTWKLDFFYPQRKLFWKVKWYNPVNLWLHEISDNKKKWRIFHHINGEFHHINGGTYHI